MDFDLLKIKCLIGGTLAAQAKAQTKDLFNLRVETIIVSLIRGATFNRISIIPLDIQILIRLIIDMIHFNNLRKHCSVENLYLVTKYLEIFLKMIFLTEMSKITLNLGGKITITLLNFILSRCKRMIPSLILLNLIMNLVTRLIMYI